MTDRDTGGLVFIAPLWLCLEFKEWEWGVGGQSSSVSDL